MRWLILGQTYFLSKLEYDSTTHVDKRTTFWCLTFDMKNQKNVEKLWLYHKCYIPLESSQWAKKHDLHRKWNLKNVQPRKTNYYFTFIMVKLKLVFRDWTFLRFHFRCSWCFLAHWDDSNGIPFFAEIKEWWLPKKILNS